MYLERYGRDDKQVVVWGHITVFMTWKFVLEEVGHYQRTKWMNNSALVLQDKNTNGSVKGTTGGVHWKGIRVVCKDIRRVSAKVVLKVERKEYFWKVVNKNW